MNKLLQIKVGVTKSVIHNRLTQYLLIVLWRQHWLLWLLVEHDKLTHDIERDNMIEFCYYTYM